VAITREGEGKEVARLSPPQTPRRRIDIEELRALTDQMRMRCRRIHAPDARRRTLLTFYVDASSSRAKRSDPD
jgi:hypothetical protein